METASGAVFFRKGSPLITCPQDIQDAVRTECETAKLRHFAMKGKEENATEEKKYYTPEEMRYFEVDLKPFPL